MATSVLLPLWVLGIGSDHPGHHLRRDLHCPYVLPANFGGLLLVVEILLGQRLFSNLCLPLLNPVLSNQTFDQHVRGEGTVLWVHGVDILHVLLARWVHWIYRNLPVP